MSQYEVFKNGILFYKRNKLIKMIVTPRSAKATMKEFICTVRTSTLQWIVLDIFLMSTCLCMAGSKRNPFAAITAAERVSTSVFYKRRRDGSFQQVPSSVGLIYPGQ